MRCVETYGSGRLGRQGGRPATRGRADRRKRSRCLCAVARAGLWTQSAVDAPVGAALV